MIIQTANIVTGFVLAAPRLKALGAKEHIENLESKLAGVRGTIGLIELGLGVVGLLERLNILSLHIPQFGASFPQTIPAILIGLILTANLFEKIPSLHNFITTKLQGNAEWIGILGIAVGLGSILFGCVLCYY